MIRSETRLNTGCHLTSDHYKPTQLKQRGSLVLRVLFGNPSDHLSCTHELVVVMLHPNHIHSSLELGQLRVPLFCSPLPCPANDSSHAWVKKGKLFPFSPVTYSEEALHHLSLSQKADWCLYSIPAAFIYFP